MVVQTTDKVLEIHPTETDASLAYGIDNREYREIDHVWTIKTTPSGRTSFEYVDRTNKKGRK